MKTGFVMDGRKALGSVIGVRAFGDEPASDELLSLVNRFALRPLGPDDFAAFSMDVCNDQVDMHFSRFPVEELTAIAAKIAGRPLMERHDSTGSMPRGTFVRGDVCNEGGVWSVRADAYVLRIEDNEGFIKNIEGGVYRDTSMGFTFTTPECSVCRKNIWTCDHIPGRDYGGETCVYIMRGVRDVLECSVVPAGSQRTQLVEQLREAGLGELTERTAQDVDSGARLRGRRIAML